MKSLDCPHGDCEDDWEESYYNLSITAPGNQVFKIKFRSSAGIIAVKTRMKEENGILVKRQRLFLDGEELSDNKGLHDVCSQRLSIRLH